MPTVVDFLRDNNFLHNFYEICFDEVALRFKVTKYVSSANGRQPPEAAADSEDGYCHTNKTNP